MFGLKEVQFAQDCVCIQGMTNKRQEYNLLTTQERCNNTALFYSGFAEDSNLHDFRGQKGNTLLAHEVGAGKSVTRSQLKRLRTSQ